MSQAMLRPLSLGEILDVSFGLYRAQLGPLLSISLVSTGLPMLLNVYVASAGGWIPNLVLLPIYAVLAIILSAIATAATVFVISESYLGRALSAGEAFRRAVPYVWRLIGLSILSGLVIGLGMILLVVPGMILLSGLILGTPVLVLENSAGPGTAMGRSWALSKGFKGKLFLLLLTMIALVYVPILAVGFLAGIVLGLTGLSGGAAAQSDAATIVIPVVAGLVQILVYPMIYCALTVSYYDLRVRKEAFDLEVLENALAAA